MTMPCMCKKVVVFDLDDTLYKEIDFLKSGYRKVSEMVEKRFGIVAQEAYDQMMKWYHRGENAFAELNEKYALDNPISDYLNIYRYHHPNISLTQGVSETLDALKEAGCELGVITDGREETQNNKIKALGLFEWINPELVIINEDKKYFKPNHWSFDRLMLKCFENGVEADATSYYVGDNPEKDFLAPNDFGWDTVCLEDDGKNIHRQNFDLADVYLPKHKIKSIVELLDIIR